MRRWELIVSKMTSPVKTALAICGGMMLIAAARPAYLMGVAVGLWPPTTRPAAVSSRARYASVFEDQAWFDCSVDHSRDVDVCRAWDADGKLIAFGIYRLDGDNRAASESELRPSHVNRSQRPDLAWIYLSNRSGWYGRFLVPVNSAGQPLERFEVKVSGDQR